MQPGSSPNILEHPFDVMRAALDLKASQTSVALAILTNCEGGAVRSPGAMMAIGADGQTYGYLSSGCVENDIKMRALEAIKANSAINVRYGSGSPFMDIRLPCGGSIDLTVIPNPNESVLKTLVSKLDQGDCAWLGLTKDRVLVADKSGAIKSSFKYRPKLNLRTAGKGAELLTLANLTCNAGFKCEVWTPDDDIITRLSPLQNCLIEKLTSPNQLPECRDSSETAFVLMFHDADWETSLLSQALLGDAFYIGAVGSRKTQSRRCETLRDIGVSQEDISRIKGPIGLVPSMRDASMLSISVLAEIVQSYHSLENLTK